MVPAVVSLIVRPPVPVRELLTTMLALFWSRMPSAEPKELTRILLKAVFRFWLVPAAPPGRKVTVLPALRLRVLMVRLFVAPRFEPLVEVMNEAPLLRATVPSVSAVTAPGVLLPRKV